MDDVAYIGLGSNLGDRMDALADAVKRISVFPMTRLVAVSQAYESEPAVASPAEHPLYANAVARVRTGLSADQLLGWLLDTEEAMGRPSAEERSGQPPEPRVIDLDLLLFGDEEWHAESLQLPHPRMKGRAFVMRPLADVGPDARWPGGGAITPAEVAAAETGPITRALGPIPGFEDETVIPGGPSADTWVELAMLSRFRPDRKPDMDLLFTETVLADAGIPYAWDPHRPTEGFNPWGVRSTLRLLVPEPYAERASRILAEAASATVEWPEDLGGDGEE